MTVRKLFFVTMKEGIAMPLKWSSCRETVKFLLVSLVFLCSIGSASFAVSADSILPVDGHFMTVADTFSLYGDTFPVTYYNGSEYVDTVATNNFSGSTKSGTITIDGESVPVVFYQVTGLSSLSTAPSFITAELRPQYSIYDTYYIYQWCGLSSYASVASSVYSPPSWLYNIGGSDFLYEGTAVNGEYTASYNLSSFFGSSWSNTKMTVIPMDYDGAISTYGYSKRIRFYGNGKSQYNNFVFFISCPYVSGDAFGSSGTPVSTTATSAVASVTVNVNVSVDNSDVISAVNAQGAEQSAAASAQQSQDSAYQESMLHGSTVQTQTIATIDESALSAAMTADIYDDLPEMIATAGFWLALLGHVLNLVPVFSAFLAGFLCLNLLVYIIWRK